MAILKPILTLLILTGSAWVIAAVHPPALSLKLARVSLENCQTLMAPLWAERLDASQPELAVLYRLAWLEKAARFEEPKLGDGLRWGWSEEIWTDEFAEYHQQNQCTEPAKLISQLPQDVLQSLLDPWLPQLNTVKRPALRDRLLQYASYQSFRGNPRELPDQAPTSEEERCRWRALRFLQGTVGSPSCLLKNSWLSVATKVKKGDQLLKSGRSKKAHAQYVSAIKESNTLGMATPAELHWRRLGTALLSHQADSEIMRLAHEILVVNSTQHPFVASLRRLTCQRARELGPKNYARVMQEVFPTQASVVREAEILAQCDGNLNVLRSVVQRIPGERLQLRWWGRLLNQAQANGDWLNARQAAIHLGKLRKQRSIASQFFWRSLEQSPRSRRLIATYRTQGPWTKRDQAQHKRWEKRRKEPAVKALRAESYRAKHSLQLPTIYFPPQVTWTAEFPSEYLSAYIHGSEEGN